MEFTQLKYFLAAAQTGSITRASEKLFITQSALSRVIQRLESELGVSLFDREPGRVSLNENGKLFQIYVSKAFDAIDQGVRAVSMNDNAGQPVIRVRSELVMDMFGTVYDMCQAEFPHLSFKFCKYYGAEDSELGAGDAADIFITSERCPGMCIVRSYTEHWGVITNKNCETSGNSLTLAELAEEPIVFYGSESDLKFVRGAFERAGLAPDIILAENMRRSASIINKGLARACVPFGLYYGYTLSSGSNIPFIPMKISDAALVREIYLCHRQGFPRSADEQAVLDRLCGHMDVFMASTEALEKELFS